MSEQVNEAKLMDLVEKANGQAARHKHVKRALQAEFDKLKAAHDQIVKEYEALKSKEAQPSELQAELDKLKAERRQDRHKAAIEKAAKGLNVGLPTDDLLKVLDYQADTDEPDEAKVKTTLEEAIKAKPYLVSQQKWEAGPGAAKGASDLSARMFTATREQLSDPLWKLANDRAIQQARKEDRFKIVD